MFVGRAFLRGWVVVREGAVVGEWITAVGIAEVIIEPVGRRQFLAALIQSFDAALVQIGPRAFELGQLGRLAGGEVGEVGGRKIEGDTPCPLRRSAALEDRRQPAGIDLLGKQEELRDRPAVERGQEGGQTAMRLMPQSLGGSGRWARTACISRRTALE